MGSIMPCFSALFLFLLDGERIMEEVRDWLNGRRWFRRYVLPIAEREGLPGTVSRALALPATIMFMGPFWRAATYHLFRLPRSLAYLLSIGGSFPHSLFWTGLVVGGLWEAAVEPLIRRIV